MSDENTPNEEQVQSQAAGLLPQEMAQLAHLTDILNQHGYNVLNVSNVVGTQYGIAIDTRIFIQTLQPQEQPREQVSVDDENVTPEREEPAPEVDE